MPYPWFDEYVQSKTGCEKIWHEEWEVDLYRIGGKMFAMVGEDNKGVPIITLKLAPARGLDMREKYDDIAPGHYMNKQHWNSIRQEGSVPDGELRSMLDESYTLVFGSLTKKTQKEIMGKGD